MPITPICVDASVVIPLVTGSPAAEYVAASWTEWYESGRALASPTLLYYEVANALHRYLVHGELDAAETAAALDAALGLEITLYGDAGIHRRALEIAGAYGLSATCDAHYLALAEKLGAELWTADRRLHETAQRAGLAAALLTL